MTQEHQFVLIDAEHCRNADYSFLKERTDVFRLHADLIEYIVDTLKWLPSLNPSRNEWGSGLNLYGLTVLQADGASTAAEVFQGWANLLRIGPPQLRLTGRWTEIEGEPDSGHYDRLQFDRDATLATLDGIASACRRAASSDGQLAILHCGI